MPWSWVTEDVVLNPADNALLADTGALPAGERIFILLFWDNVAGIEVLLQWRDSTNTVNKKQHIIRNTTIGDKLIVRFKPLLNERVRVLNRTLIAGSAQASIFYNA